MGPRKFVYSDVLHLEAERDEPNVFLYSGDTCFMAGNDSNEINRVGSVIYGGEGFFGGFLDKHELGFRADRYDAKVQDSLSELAITPSYRVSAGDVRPTLREIVAITNQVLGVLQKQYDKTCRLLRNPEVA